MAKLVLKKIGVFIAMLFLSFIAIYICAFIFEQIKSLVDFSPKASSIITGFITMVVLIGYAYQIKVENKAVKIKFNEEKSNLVSFLSKIKFILISKNYIGNVIALNIILLPFEIAVGISEKTSLLPLIMGAITLFLYQTIFFTITDIIFSLIVFSVWNRRR